MAAKAQVVGMCERVEWKSGLAFADGGSRGRIAKTDSSRFRVLIPVLDGVKSDLCSMRCEVGSANIAVEIDSRF